MHSWLAWWKVFLEQIRCWKPCIAKPVITCLRSYSSSIHSLLTIASVMYKLSSIESLFSCSFHSSSSYAGVCCRSICILKSSVRKVSLAKTYTYRDRANFETPNTFLRYLGFRLSRSCSLLVIGIPTFLLARM